MDKEEMKKGVRGMLTIFFAMMGIGFMALSFHLAISGGLSYSPEAMMYGRLQAIHNMLIALGFFLLSLIAKP